MSIAAGIFLAAVGAILKFAVADSINGVDLGTIGVILMIAGILIAVIAALYEMSHRDRVVEEPVARREVVRDRRIWITTEYLARARVSARALSRRAAEALRPQWALTRAAGALRGCRGKETALDKRYPDLCAAGEDSAYRHSPNHLPVKTRAASLFRPAAP